MKRIERLLEETMTASQLIEELQNMDPDAPVFFTADYGDHSHTMQALAVAEVESTASAALVESAYSRSGVAYKGDDLRELDGDEEEHPIVILNSSGGW